MSYNKQFDLSRRGKVNSYIIEQILPQLSSDHVFIDTSSITVNDSSLDKLDAEKIAVCYSSIDWENTGCISLRTDAHKIIRNNSWAQIHIGNSYGPYYFGYWAEFIRQNPKWFFDECYTQEPKIEKLYLCQNRKLHPFRVEFLELLDSIKDRGIISRGTAGFTDPVYNIKELDPHESENHGTMVNDIFSLGNPDVWNRIFIDVVTESCKHSNVFLSEKTWKPIIGLRPFLILGDDNLYNQLHLLGFDTFDDIFGTWWTLPHWRDRAQAIVDILKNFDSTNQDLNMLYQKLLPRLHNNRTRFEEYMIENHNRIRNLGL
jgi:hypothetical protein